MSPHSASPGSARSSAELNEDIRHLWQRAGGYLTAEQRREYEQLVTRWSAAVERERAAALLEAA
ncbi:hypothetical protein [Streptomyces sp. NPDC047070]|uniref:hypothetical protein n=1 Tax=Streptomyces sp. NPDC047070 TaxID=3154923 RepID=UPI003452058B